MHARRWTRLLLVAVAGISLAACGSSHDGDVGGPLPDPDLLLASYPLGDGAAIQPATPGQNYQVVMIVGHQDIPPPPPLAPTGITRVDVSPPLAEGAAPGRHVYLPGNDAQVDAFLARVADGTDDTVGGGWRIGVDSGFNFASDVESRKLENRAAWLTGPDLAGATITRLVVDVTFVGFDPQDLSRYIAHGTVSFYGTP